MQRILEKDCVCVCVGGDHICLWCIVQRVRGKHDKRGKRHLIIIKLYWKKSFKKSDFWRTKACVCVCMFVCMNKCVSVCRSTEGQAPTLARSVALSWGALGHTVSLSGWLNMAAQHSPGLPRQIYCSKIHSVGDTVVLVNQFKKADENGAWNP